MNKPTLKEQAHGEIEKIFRILLPQNGLSVREEQITLCHAMLDTLLKNNIALCDAGVGIGKTYAYLTACILLKKFAPHGPAGSQPVVISTSSVALQDSIIEEYIPFLSRIFLENRVISKPIRAIVRKGKERFVCDARLSQRLEAVKDINTANMSNEMFLSMMSAFAQEESISISKNMRKGAVMRMKNGTFRLSQAPYGYYLDEKGILIVQQEESKIVQRIFGNFLSGMGIQEIAAELQKEHIPKLNGEPIWSYTGILYILTNERYIGDELFQKRYTTYRDLNEYADFIDNTRLILTILDSPMPVFSSSVFRNIVSRITVTHETLRFQLVNGLELEEERISGG